MARGKATPIIVDTHYDSINDSTDMVKLAEDMLKHGYSSVISLSVSNGPPPGSPEGTPAVEIRQMEMNRPVSLDFPNASQVALAVNDIAILNDSEDTIVDVVKRDQFRRKFKKTTA